MLILAGIALNLTIGENGLFTRAQNAANTWQLAEQNEQNAMNSLASWIDSVSGEKDNNDETEPTYTKVFAQLYDNGDGSETLVFTNNDEYRENGLTYKQSWNITDKHFILGDSPETSIMPPWLDASAGHMNSTIKEVKLVNEIKPKYTSCMFFGLEALDTIEGMENLNTENTLDISNMFMLCQSLTNIDLSRLDTSNVTNMSMMFCMNPGSKLESITFGEKFNTSKVVDMSSMFTNCKNITNLNLSDFDTSNVTDMPYMFECCESLTSLNLSSFDTSNVTMMSYMFRDCTNLSTIYVGPNWTTKNADTSDMFEGCGTQEVTPKN